MNYSVLVVAPLYMKNVYYFDYELNLYRDFITILHRFLLYLILLQFFSASFDLAHI